VNSLPPTCIPTHSEYYQL